MPYPHDIKTVSEIYALLDATWPGLARKISQARYWGARWDWTSQPFMRRVNKELASLVGVIEMPLRIGGRDVAVAGIHGVCTAAAHRRQGLMGSALREALAWVDQRWPAAILWTDQPFVYESAGFEAVSEHIWVGATARFPDAGRYVEGGADVTALDLNNLSHLEVLRVALMHRAPVSDVVATREPGWHALIDLALMERDRPVLWWIPTLRSVVAVELPKAGSPALKILDVIAPEIPSLDALLPWLPCKGAQRLEVWCNLNRLPLDALSAVPHPWPDQLMARNAAAIGLEPALLGPFAFSVLTHC